jgi:predicted outer membrane repeat protein
MGLRSFLACWISWSQRTRSFRQVAQHRHSFRPGLEALENRWVPSTLQVTSNADNGAAGTLRWAVAQAQPGDTIQIDTTRPIKLTQGVIPLEGKDLTIEGGHSTPATISGNGKSPIFSEEFGNVTLQNLDLTDGNAVNTSSRAGGAILDWGGQLNVSNCVFSGNAAHLGGAIAAETFYLPSDPEMPVVPIVSISNSTFSANTAAAGGAIYDASGTPQGSFQNPQMNIEGCNFFGNAATSGGAVFLSTGTGYVSISSSSFAKNSGYAVAGEPGSQVEVAKNAFSANTPGSISGQYTNGGGNTGL